MSLNFREIDLVLSELAIAGMKVQKVFQPSYDTIILELYGARGKKDLLISVAAGACRIHAIRANPAKNDRPLRFMECLRSRIRGGLIESAEQLSSDRIVRLSISVPQAPSGASNDSAGNRGAADGAERADGAESCGVAGDDVTTRKYRLYARLWSGAGNILLVDEDDVVVDALFRKPEKSETSGSRCLIEGSLPTPDREALLRKSEKFAVRDIPGDGSFSERIEAYYSAQAGDVSRENLLKLARERFDRRMRFLEIKEAETEATMKEYQNADRYRQIGDILMATQADGAAAPLSPLSSKIFVSAYDFYADKPVSIQIDPALTYIENAKRYYEKYRKANSGLSDVVQELAKLKQAKEQLRAWLAHINAEQDPFAMAKVLEKAGTVREEPLRRYPCIWLEDKGWIILVGRSAKENDELLRHHVRGSDLWLHARDYSGSYVFIKAQKGKTFPLDIMIDAACLAVYYSKARKNMEGNVYYTHAKYLRRAKDGPKGLVIPSMEKNLFVHLEDSVIKELLADSSGGDS